LRCSRQVDIARRAYCSRGIPLQGATCFKGVDRCWGPGSCSIEFVFWIQPFVWLRNNFIMAVWVPPCYSVTDRSWRFLCAEKHWTIFLTFRRDFTTASSTQRFYLQKQWLLHFVLSLGDFVADATEVDASALSVSSAKALRVPRQKPG